jgi:ABC-type nitrate/sulfonate/bicarbonate transport system substrate-binding protein
MEKIKILAAPGPVSYPIIAANDSRFEIVFSKEGDADVVLHSSVGMIKRGLRANVSLISGLAGFTPGIGKKIAVYGKGNSTDVLARAVLNLKGLNSEIVYVDDQSKVREMLLSGEVDSAVTTSANGKIITFEELLAESGIEMPGSCVAKVSETAKKAFREAYEEGLRKFRENPEETANAVASALPVKTSPEFIRNAILKSRTAVNEIKNDEDFIALVKKFS